MSQHFLSTVHPAPVSPPRNIQLIDDDAMALDPEPSQNEPVQQPPTPDTRLIDDDVLLGDSQSSLYTGINVDDAKMSDDDPNDDEPVTICTDLVFPKGYEDYATRKRLCKKWNDDKKNEGFSVFDFDPLEGKWKCTVCEKGSSNEKYASWGPIPWL